jgi:hypothetical protein
MSFIRPTLEELNESLAAGGYGPSFRDQPKPGAKKKQRPEDALHIQVAKYLRYAIAHEGKCSLHGAIWWSYESRNAGKETVTKNGRKINLEGIGRKARGCIAGLPDISVLFRGGLHGIELKADKGTLSEAQRTLHPEMRKAGGKVVVARSLDDVEAALRGWDIPTRVRP